MCAAGLNAIEAYHSDHGPRETQLYLELAGRYGLLVTGGSDFHGEVKPGVSLGTGYGGNLRIPPTCSIACGQAAVSCARKPARSPSPAPANTPTT